MKGVTMEEVTEQWVKDNYKLYKGGTPNPFSSFLFILQHIKF